MLFFIRQYPRETEVRKLTSVVVMLLMVFFVLSCTKSVKYTKEYVEQTSGRYLFDQDNIIDVFYENEKLFVTLGGVKTIEPVILDEETFFVADIYKKFRFVEHPETKKRYLSIISDANDNLISYDYLKVDDTYKTPRMHLESGNYDKALEGYLEIKAQDSTNVLIDEAELNSLGYRLLRKKEYDNAIEVFNMNVLLYPESANVYDSLADGYLAQGDSLQAFENFKKTLELNEHNRKANKFVTEYQKKKN